MIENNPEEYLKIPPRIGRLFELANNLWWSWSEDGRQVFRSLDYALWRTSEHNPVKQLRSLSAEKLEAAARDPGFLELYDTVMAKFDQEMTREHSWCGETTPDVPNGPVAYFSAEYAIHNSLPIYAGGLGVLAGELCKECSDRGVPLLRLDLCILKATSANASPLRGTSKKNTLNWTLRTLRFHHALGPTDAVH